MQFPGLGNMPVLGALFRSRDYQNNETELVVLVSAYLVNPTSEKRLRRADRQLRAAERISTRSCMGRLNAAACRSHPNSLKSAANGKNGFIVQ